MASTIKLKNGSGAPTAGDLVQGEPALDLTNKRLYTEDSGGTVIEVGVNPTSLTTGTFTSTGIDDNATSTAITIDSSENVGIGTSSPLAPLVVSGGGDENVEFFAASVAVNGGGIQYINRNDEGTRPDFNYFLANGGGSHKFYTGAAERMRIDSSGNLLVSTTSDFASGTVDGIIAQGTNKPAAAFSNTASGQIVKFYEGGSLVGSIGTAGGLIQIGQGNANLKFSNAADVITPANGSGSNNDNAIDLGSASARFKNLYLSGGVYLGGTGAANKLDDYEEGTWVPTPNVGTFSSTSCSYTKVGRLVTLTFDAVVGTGGGSTMQAPITAANTTASGIYTSLQDFSAGRTAPTIIIGGGTTTMYFRDVGDNVSATGLGLTAGATITFTLSYITA